jgi:hypothetical protein
MHVRYLTAVLLLSVGATVAMADASKPELDGNCAMSAVIGAKRPTSCAVVWISPQDKLYCFSNEQAKAAFLRDPEGNERRAQAFWKDPSFYERLLKQQPEG